MRSKFDPPAVVTSEYLSASDLCVLLGISRACIYRWLREGRVPRGIRIGPNCVRWKRADVEAWLAAKAAVSK